MHTKIKDHNTAHKKVACFIYLQNDAKCPLEEDNHWLERPRELEMIGGSWRDLQQYYIRQDNEEYNEEDMDNTRYELVIIYHG